MPTRRGPRQSSASDAAPDTRADDLEAPADAAARAATCDTVRWTFRCLLLSIFLLLLWSVYHGVPSLRVTRRAPAQRSPPATQAKEASPNLFVPAVVNPTQLLKSGTLPAGRDVAKRGPPSDRSKGRKRSRVDQGSSANKRPLEGAADREPKKSLVESGSSTNKRPLEGASVESVKRLRGHLPEHSRVPTQQPTSVPTGVPTGVPTSTPTTEQWAGCTPAVAMSQEQHDLLTNGKDWNEEGRTGIIVDEFDFDESDTCEYMNEAFDKVLEREIVIFALPTEGIDTDFPETVFDTLTANRGRWNTSLVRSGCENGKNRQVAVHRGFCDDVREMAEGLDDSHMESFWRYIKPLADFGGMCRMRGFPL